MKMCVTDVTYIVIARKTWFFFLKKSVYMPKSLFNHFLQNKKIIAAKSKLYNYDHDDIEIEFLYFNF